MHAQEKTRRWERSELVGEARGCEIPEIRRVEMGAMGGCTGYGIPGQTRVTVGETRQGLKPEPFQGPAGSGSGAQRFVTTHWSVVLAASQPQAAGHHDALERLCRTYWYPVYAFVRRKGHSASDAEDLTQEFFSRLLAKEWLVGIEENGSRFRSFLLTAVSRFLANEHDRVTAAKRGGGMTMLNLEDAEERFVAEGSASETAERAYDRNWAILVMHTALTRLAEEAQEEGRGAIFGALSPFLSREPQPGEYEELAGQLKMSVNSLGVAVHRLRRRYREEVRVTIGGTVAVPGEVDEELRHLIAVLRG